ncbi:MAG TPA: hypothetical protein VFZ31_05755 [Vicinamibacterales bacterium]
MHAKFAARTIAALALVLLPAAARVSAADNCLCTTHRLAFRTSDGNHNWFVTADASASLKVTLAIEITTTNTGEINHDHLNASIYSPAGALLHTIHVEGHVPGWFRQDVTIAPTSPGDVYRVEIHRATPHPTPFHASGYYLRFDGGADAAIDSPLRAVGGGRTTWTLHADAGDAMGVRLFDPLTYPNDPGDYPVMYQWISPSGVAQPIGSYTVPGPGMDTVLPPPAGLVPGKWQLRLQTLSFAGPGWGYVIEKTTGTDRRLHVEPGQAGRGNGGRIRFVDESGAPFTEPVAFTFGFGESFTFMIPGGLFETTNGTDTFPIPVLITPPPGMVATPSSLVFNSPCDGFSEQTVVISAAPPSLTVSLSPNVLWPPNNKLAAIEATIVSDASVELVSIVSSEPGTDDVAGAAFGTDDRAFQLRATRGGGGSGRTYAVTYRATSAAGASTTVTATVVVPHDQRK